MRTDSESLGECKDLETAKLGEPAKIVRIEITYNKAKGTLKISQEKYIENLLTMYGLEKGNTVGTPMDPSVNLAPTEKRKTETVATPMRRLWDH